MIYDKLSSLSGDGSIKTEYMQDGKSCYKAFIKAKGLYDEAHWENLVWQEQYAWCEAARAVRFQK